jgi:hypothetical protein
MKAIAQGRLIGFQQGPQGDYVVPEGTTRLCIRFKGKIDGDGATGRDVAGDFDIYVADRFANKVRIGSPIHLVIGFDEAVDFA